MSDRIDLETYFIERHGENYWLKRCKPAPATSRVRWIEEMIACFPDAESARRFYLGRVRRGSAMIAAAS